MTTPTLKSQLSVLLVGILTGILIYIFYLYALNPLPFTEEYLFKIDEKWKQLLLLKAGIVFQFIVASIVIIPLICISIGIQIPKNTFIFSRVFSLGVILVFTYEQLDQFGSRNANMWYIVYISQIIIIFLLSYVFIKIGSKFKKT